MVIALVFSSLALGLVAAALVLAPDSPLAWALLWPAMGAGIVALAYFGSWPQLLGKRADGRLAWWAVAVGLPLIAINLVVWHLTQWLIRESASDEVAPGIYVGRWPRVEELPADVHAIVDLTAEFPARAGVRAHPGYRAHPLLDTTCPAATELEAIVRPLVDVPGPILIHCAVGHGRSATIAAALALARGHFDDPDRAITRMQQLRPRVHPRPRQRERLQQWFANTRT